MPSGASGSCRYQDFCIQAAWYSGRKLTISRLELPATASTHSSIHASLAASSQCRSSISVTAWPSTGGRWTRLCKTPKRIRWRSSADIDGPGCSGSGTHSSSKRSGSALR